MTDNRVIEFQRLSLVRQQEHLDEALRRMREAERRAADSDERIEALLAELEVAHDHNTVLVAMAQRDRRLLQALRAELKQVRAMLDDAPSITEPGGFAGVQTGEPR